MYGESDEGDSDYSDKLFNELIEVDDVGSEKENTPVKQNKPKTKSEQYDKIVAFMNDYNEELIDKDVYAELWKNLTSKLNDIGPPIRSSTEWRRVWSVYKYNNKKKRSNNESLNAEPPKSFSRRDQLPHFIETTDKAEVADLIGHRPTSSSHSIGRSDKTSGQDVVSQQANLDRDYFQSEILVKLNVIIHLLEEISKRIICEN